METWFLLFDGNSPDGMGSSDFIKRTTDKELAIAHYKMTSKNPYSTGKVIIITDTIHTNADNDTAWGNL